MAYSGEAAPAGGGRIQVILAILFVLAAIAAGALAEPDQQRVAGALRSTVLRPFIAVQERVTRERSREGEVEDLMARVDSLSAALLIQETLVDENRALRDLLVLGERIGPEFHAATLLRPGTPGAESMFLLDLGFGDGVRAGAPVVTAEGLLGVVREVGQSSAVGMDWTHPDFRASGMVVEGAVYGIIENRRGDFREEDRLVLTGTAYNEVLADGSMVLTSGLGGIYPRGIPVGTIDGVAGFQGTWRKSYWVRPAVQPAAATHVLVAAATDSVPFIVWPVDTIAVPRVPGVLADSAAAADTSAPAGARDTVGRAVGVRTGSPAIGSDTIGLAPSRISLPSSTGRDTTGSGRGGSGSGAR